MTTRALLLAAAGGLAVLTAYPALSQSQGQQAASQAVAPQAAAAPQAAPPQTAAKPPNGLVDVNAGRFDALGGPFGEIRTACVRCHELDGSGNSSGAFPRLTDQSGWYLYKTLMDFAAGLRPSDIMGPIAKTLTSREMQNLAAYYASLKDAPYPGEKPDVDVQTLQIGGALVAVGDASRGVPACVSCHGQNGIGNPPIYPFIAGQFAPYIERQLTMWKQGKRHGDPMSVMEMIAKNMSDAQIHAVAVYLASVRPKEVTPNDALFRTPAAEREAGTASAATTGIRGNPTDMGATINPQPAHGDTVVPGTPPQTGTAPSTPNAPAPQGGAPK